MRIFTGSGLIRVASVAALAAAFAGCANDVGEERRGTTTQADSISDIMGIIGDAESTAVLAPDAPFLAVLVAGISVIKDEYGLGLDLGGGSSGSPPQTDPRVIAAINQLEGDVGNLQSSIQVLDASLQADVNALALWDIWDVRSDLEAIALVLSQNIGQAPILGRPAPAATVSLLQAQVDLLESKIAVALEPMRANVPPDANDGVLALLENTYALALRLRLEYAAAGFPMAPDWALARTVSTPARCHYWGSLNQGPDPACAQAMLPSLTAEAAFGVVMTELVDPYHPIRAADFDHDGIADIVIHDPITQNVVVARTVKSTNCGWFPVCYQAGNVPGGWVHVLGQIDPKQWRLQAVADINKDGNPDIVFGPSPARLWSVHQGSQPTVGAPTPFVYTGDYDGGLSTIWYTASNFTLASTETNYFTSTEGWSGGNLHSSPIGAGDFNGDGFTDLLVGGIGMLFGNAPLGNKPGTWGAFASVQGHNGFRPPRTPNEHVENALLFVNPDFGTAGNSTSYSAWYDTHWHMRGVGDFTGGRASESVWYHSDDGAVQLWTAQPPETIMQISSGPAQVTYGSEHMTISNLTLPAGWTKANGDDLLDAADFSNDGKPDLLWKSGSELAVMTMSGTTEQLVAPLTLHPSP
jgi:hypothetical protein